MPAARCSLPSRSNPIRHNHLHAPGRFPALECNGSYHLVTTRSPDTAPWIPPGSASSTIIQSYPHHPIRTPAPLPPEPASAGGPSPTKTATASNSSPTPHSSTQAPSVASTATSPPPPTTRPPAHRSRSASTYPRIPAPPHNPNRQISRPWEISDTLIK